MLTFGVEAIIPIEIRLPSLRELEPEASGHMTEHLNFLVEVWEQVALLVASYQKD